MKNKISFIIEHSAIKSDNDFFEHISKIKFKDKSFPNSDAIEFVSQFSKSILLDKNARAFPELIVLANFFKRKNLFKNIHSELDKNKEFIQVPLGKIFHIAPSNVDTIFLYSSLIALLCGNICLIRISSNKTTQLDFVIEKLKSTLASYKSMKDKIFVFTYNHDYEITKKISEAVQSRVVWGGDETIKEIRSIPLNPLAREIVFPNRFSFSIIKSKAVYEYESNLNSIIKGFYNDTSYFNQQACSSPKLIIWFGSHDDNLKARNIFWNHYNDYVMANNINDDAGMVMDRFVASSFYAANNLASKSNDVDYPTKLNITDLSSRLIREAHPGNGLFLELEKNNIIDVADEIREIDQTMSYVGFTKKEIVNFAMHVTNRGIDRIVPIGHSLDFNAIWDGYDLVEQFSRKVTID